MLDVPWGVVLKPLVMASNGRGQLFRMEPLFTRDRLTDHRTMRSAEALRRRAPFTFFAKRKGECGADSCVAKGRFPRLDPSVIPMTYILPATPDPGIPPGP